MSDIEHIALYRVRTPLIEPYQLSYGPVTVLDSVFCRVDLADGKTGWGESTPLPGYCPSDAAAAWDATRRAAKIAVGLDARTASFVPANGDWFLTTALQTACEEASSDLIEWTGSVPLIGLIRGKTADQAISSLEEGRAVGHREFKAKIGILPPADEAALIQSIQSAMRPGEWLRLDGNQGLTLAASRIVAAACDPSFVRYIEQPLPEEAWSECVTLAQESPVPIALDEAIGDMASIERTAETSAARYIKLKWMKQGSARSLSRLARRATDLGLGVIFGNGVSTAWNNRQEAMFWLSDLAAAGLAGEMNGFIKSDRPSPGLEYREGCAWVTPLASSAEPFPPGDAIDNVTFGPRNATYLA